MTTEELERLERGKRLKDGIRDNHARIKLLMNANDVGYSIGLVQYKCGVIVRDVDDRGVNGQIGKDNQH